MIVIVYKPGQLANRLFLFAKFLAYGRAHNVTILNPSFDDYLDYFEKTKKQIIPTSKGLNGIGNKRFVKGFYFILFYFARFLHRTNLKSQLLSVTYLDWHEHFDLENDVKLCRKGIHFIQGWEFKADRLLVKYKPDIVDFFLPAMYYQKIIDSFMNAIRKPSQKIMGLHIRQGDYKIFEGGKYYFETDEYLSIMKNLISNESNILFVVCTNNPELNPIYFEGVNVKMGPGHPLTDLYVLSQCDYVLGPPSTYSLWASYYGNVPLYQIEDPKKNFGLTDFKSYLG